MSKIELTTNDEQLRSLSAKVDLALAAVTALQTEMKTIVNCESSLGPSESGMVSKQQSKVDLTHLSTELSRIWKTQATAPLADLQQQLFRVIRDHDFDPNGPVVSDLMAAKLESTSNGFNVSREPMHVVLGLVSDTDLDVTVHVSGNYIGVPLQLRANVPHPILVDAEGRAWPLVSPDYHEIQLEIPTRTAPCTIHGLGVRLKKSECHTITDTLVPGVCRIHQGMCYSHKDIAFPGDVARAGAWSPMV